MAIKIFGGVCVSGEYQNLAIARVQGRGHLLLDDVDQVLELGVLFNTNLFHLSQEALNDLAVAAQVSFPRRDIHVSEVDLDLLADGKFAKSRQVIIVGIQVFHVIEDIFDPAIAATRLEAIDGLQHRADVSVERAQCEAECLYRAFKALQKVRRHQRLQAALAIGLAQRTFGALRLGVVELFIFSKTARLDVVHRRVDSHF